MFNSFYFLLYSGNGDTTFFGNNLYIENIKSVAFPYDQKYYWRVRSENLNGVSEWSETWSFTTSSPTSVDEKIIPDQISLEQNYPNPFNPSTKISWQSSVTSHQTIKVYDVLGNEVATLVDEFRNAGSYEINFNANSLSSGIYFYKLTIGSFVDSKKMILLR
ncbi:MAG: T9SS type A sorting domain-containing protein [Ignavibacteriales bacterium]|nr:T9SS type A sorting domain-containing protein [Ignavibacteriales bacterium]